MRPISIILLVVAVLSAGAAVFVGRRVVSKSAAEAAAAQKVASQDVEVLVAARDLPQGRQLVEADVRWEHWPNAAASTAHALVRQSGQETMAQLPGTAARRNIVAGEPIKAESLFTPGQAGFMAAMVSPGMKAVGVTVTAASTASGFVLPGDLVDVILTVDLRKNEVALPGGGRFASEIILRDVRVLAVDQTLTPGSAAAPGATAATKSKRISSKKPATQTRDDSAAADEVAMVGKTVALEVTPSDGERLLAAQAAGTLSLALRSLAQDDGELTREAKADGDQAFASDVDSSRALRMAVGGGVKVIKGGEVAH